MLVVSTETFGLNDSYYSAIVIQKTLDKIISKRIKIKILTDIDTLFNFIIRNASTNERQLIFNVNAAIKT